MSFVEGQQASNLEVVARWAYSEIVSPRVGKYFRSHLGSFCDIARAGTPFEALVPMHHEILAAAMRKVRGSLVQMLEEQHDGFALELWNKDRLSQSLALSFFNTPGRDKPLPFPDFLVWPRDTGDDGTVDVHDPRVAADALRPGSLRIREAAIAIGPFPHVLIDGYLRSIVFLRDAPADALLPVWVGSPR